MQNKALLKYLSGPPLLLDFCGPSPALAPAKVVGPLQHWGPPKWWAHSIVTHRPTIIVPANSTENLSTPVLCLYNAEWHRGIFWCMCHGFSLSADSPYPIFPMVSLPDLSCAPCQGLTLLCQLLASRVIEPGSASFCAYTSTELAHC